ncbi:sensor domain-containing protein [Nonomuraea sp. NPDC046570]|uniref:sensor domain-containing protein n=1 Tax=Nonomuraea sp. NPDC046570 TaxID=3155255 RepID=UPI0033F59F59
MTTFPRRIATDTRYALMGFPASVASFALTITGVAAGLGSAVAFVGLPVLAGTAAMSRGFADVERAALPGVLGHPVARPHYNQAPAQASWFRRTMNPLTSAQAWLDLLHPIIAFPFALIAFVFSVVWWAGAIAGLTFPLYGWILFDIPGMDGGLPSLLGLGDSLASFVGFNTGLGALFALTLLPVLRGAALLKASLAQSLLTTAGEHTLTVPPRRIPAGV